MAGFGRLNPGSKVIVLGEGIRLERTTFGDQLEVIMIVMIIYSFHRALPLPKQWTY